MRRTKVKRKAFAAVLAAAFAASLPVGAVTCYGAVTDYDWSGGADYGGYTVPYAVRDSEDEMEIGPGMVPNVDSVIESGPSVSQSAIVEQYHADYKIYEESIEGIFFFYSNVANGGITHEPVELDLPANLTWTVEKNGASWTYESGQPITEYGTYVFRLRGIEDASVPLSEQKEYRAVFRFRIQEKPPEEETSAAAEAGGIPEETVGGYDSALLYGGQVSGGLYLGPNGLQVETEIGTSGPGDIGSITGNDASGETGESPAPEESAPEESEGTSGEDGTGEAPQTDGGTDAIEAKDAENAEGVSGTEASAFVQTFDVSSGKYQVAFGDGTVIQSNVPGGYVGAGPVELSCLEGGWDAVRLYKDDELCAESESGEAGGSRIISEIGYYRAEAGGSSWSFAVLTATNGMDVYPAPAGMAFKEASLDGKPLALSSKNYVLMEEDGQYALTLEGEEGNTLTVGLKKDTEAPVMEVTLSKGAASIQYLSDDIATVLLERSGEPVENFDGYSVTSPGSYRLTIADAAGNTASASFTLKYQVNGYGIAAVILILFVIAGVVAFVIHTKRNVKIR